MDKKGNILDFFYLMPLLLLIGVSLFAVFIVVDKVDDITIFHEYPDAEEAISISKNTILSFDNMMLFVIIGLSLFVILSSAMVFNHPAFFIVSFVLLCIAVTVSAIVSNSWYNFYNQADILAVSANFPKLTFLFDNLPKYIAFMGIATLVAGYVGYMKR